MDMPAAGRRRPAWFVVCTVAGALLVGAACGPSGASTSTAPPAAPGTAAASPASSAPSAPAGSPSAASASPAGASPAAGALFGLATSKLADLTSYRFKVSLEGKGASAGEAQSGGSVTMLGTVILKPAKALRFDMTSAEAGASASGQTLSYVLIGDKAWFGTGGQMTQMPAESAAGMASSFDSFLPEKLFGTDFGAYASGYRMVGEEQKNGVACQHFQADSSVLQQYASLYGVTGDWHADVWIASDGGFPVSWDVSGSAASGGASGTYSVSVDITNINDPANKVSAPS